MSFSPEAIERKFSSLNATQESIQTTSQWCLFHHKSHEVVINVWAKMFLSNKTTNTQRLNLFYLANDMLQLSKKDNKYEPYLKEFKKYLPRCVTHLNESLRKSSDSKALSGKYARCFRVWKDRKVYDDPFVDRLIELLQNGDKNKSATEATNGSNGVGTHPSLIKVNEMLVRLDKIASKKSAAAVISLRSETVLELGKLIQAQQNEISNHSRDSYNIASLVHNQDEEAGSSSLINNNNNNTTFNVEKQEDIEEASPAYDAIDDDDDDDDEAMPTYTKDDNSDNEDEDEIRSEKLESINTDGATVTDGGVKRSSEVEEGEISQDRSRRSSTGSSGGYKRVRFADSEVHEDQDDLTALLTKLS